MGALRGEITSSCSLIGMGRQTGYLCVLFQHLKHRLTSLRLMDPNQLLIIFLVPMLSLMLCDFRSSEKQQK